MPSFLLPSNQVNQYAYHIKGRMIGVGAPCLFQNPLFGYSYPVKGQSTGNVDSRSSLSGGV